MNRAAFLTYLGGVLVAPVGAQPPGTPDIEVQIRNTTAEKAVLKEKAEQAPATRFR